MSSAATLAAIQPASNAFARVARAKKVAALVEHFDRLLARMGKNPHAVAAEMARTLRDFDQLSWFAHAKSAGQRKPSLETQADVIATYERRAVAK